MASMNETKIILSASDLTVNAFKSAQASIASLKGAAAGLGVTLSGAAFVGFIKSSIDAADNLNDLAKSTGTTVSALASLKLISEQSGTSLEAVGKGINKMSIFMAENADQAKRLGITAKDPVQAFIQLSDALSKIESPQQRANTANKILGKSYQDLMPLLLEGGDALKKAASDSRAFAEQMEKAAPMADAFNDKLALLKQSASQAGMSMTVNMLPVLDDIAKAMNKAAKEGGLLKALWIGLGASVVAGFGGAINPLERMENKSRDLFKELLDAKRKLGEMKSTQDAGGVSGFLITDADITRQQRYVDDVEKRMRGINSLRQSFLEPVSEPVKPVKKDGVFLDDDKSAKAAADKAKKIFDENRKQDERNAKVEFDIDWGNIEGADDAIRKNRDELATLKSEFIALIDPVEQYRKKLDDIDRLQEAGIFNADQAMEARFAINEQIDALNNVSVATKEAADFGKEMGLTFSSAFEDSIVKGAEFGDMLKSLSADIARIVVRKSITEPLGNSVSSAVSSSGIGDWFKNILPSFDVGTNYVPRDMIAKVHKGEAIVPAKYNAGGGGGGTTNHFTVDMRGASIEAVQRLEQMVAQVNGSIERRALTAMSQARVRGVS
jgi:hypothetical protein